MGWVTWRVSMRRALYGPGGFYLRPEGPAGHFRTSTHASDHFAAALARLAGEAGLGQVVDLGAGRGELLLALHRVDPGLRLRGVERAPRPAALPPAIGWAARLPPGLEALVVANEWLDVVPLDVVVRTGEPGARGVRRLRVDPATGAERPGPPPGPADLAWLDAWWPLAGAAPGARAEVGRPRDAAWAGVIRRLRRGLVVAVDYGHGRADRVAGRYAAGTLAGYRAGRRVPPVPDGGCDLTAHVALDAAAAAGQAAGAQDTVLTSQAAALRALGLSGGRPPLDRARADPAGYLAGLVAAGEVGELTDPGGLGGFSWLVQSVGGPLPPVLAALRVTTAR